MFDTGTRPDDLLANLRSYGKDVRDLDAVILSHDHFNHTDGSAGILDRHPDVPVYVHRDWDEPQSFSSFRVLEANRVDVDGGRECTEIAEGLHLTECHRSVDYGEFFAERPWFGAFRTMLPVATPRSWAITMHLACSRKKMGPG